MIKLILLSILLWTGPALAYSEVFGFEKAMIVCDSSGCDFGDFEIENIEVQFDDNGFGVYNFEREKVGDWTVSRHFVMLRLPEDPNRCGVGLHIVWTHKRGRQLEKFNNFDCKELIKAKVKGVVRENVVNDVHYTAGFKVYVKN